MHYHIDIDPKAYGLISSLLSRGIVELNGNTLDFTPVQNISITNGVLTLTPPAKIKVNIGPIALRTTISSLTVRGSGIRVEIDNSPIDVELRPK